MASRAYRTAVPAELGRTRRELQSVNLRIGRHVTMCARCSRAGRKTQEMCDQGWELAKAQSRAQNAVRRAEDRASSRPVQGSLW